MIPPPAGSLDGYRIQIAQHIHQHDRDQIFDGPPPNPLRSIVVIRYAVDAQGHLVRSQVMRSNGIAALERRALDSLRRASPLPMPAASLRSRQKNIELIETWLFDAQGRYQLRSLADPQAAGS